MALTHSNSYRHHLRDRGHPVTSSRSFMCTLLVAAAVPMLVGGGCGGRPSVDRWPIASASIGDTTLIAWACPPKGAGLGSNLRAVHVADYVTCITSCPGAGLLAFTPHAFFNVTSEHRPSGPGGRDLPWIVRAAVPIGRTTLALLTEGRAVAPDDAQAHPWLRRAQVRLAVVKGDDLRIGAPELPADVNPWRIRAGRFAGEENLLVFVYNRAPFDPVMRCRPWIYRVVAGSDGHPHLEPRWRGTSFAHPFRDATFCNLTGTGEGEIAALEVTRDGGRMLTVYHFEGFGLEGMAPSRMLPPVEDRLEAADVDGDACDELIVHLVGEEPGFAVYGLRNAPAPTLIEIARSTTPHDLIGWLPLGESAGRFRIFCLQRSGATVEIPVPVMPRPER